MKRKPTFSPYIGSISSGTMRPEDLIPTFASCLAGLLKRCRVNRETRKDHIALVNEANKLKDYDTEDAGFINEELSDALQHYAPPYTYFGAHEGNGADYGFWPVDIDEAVEDGEIKKHDSKFNVPNALYGQDVYLVNDHGNVECGRYDKRGRWHEYWSCV